MTYAFLIGFFSGLRSLTPTACIAWAAYIKRIQLPRPFCYLGTQLGLGIAGFLAILELLGDKHPGMPNRTRPPALLARLAMGALAAVCVGCVIGLAPWRSAPLGAAGALVGTFVGFYARRGTVNALGLPDITVALVEDFLCLAGSLFLLYQLG